MIKREAISSSGLNPALDYEPGEDGRLLVEVVDSLGVATKLLEAQGDIRPYKAWMAITTAKDTYPDEMVLEFARWGAEHSAGMTVVVSDWLQRYNWVVQSKRGWRAFFEGKHIKGLDGAARQRVRQLRELFEQNGVNSNVVLWSDVLKDIGITPGGYPPDPREVAEVHERLMDFERKRFGGSRFGGNEVEPIVRELAPHLIAQAIAEGWSEEEAVRVLGFYASDEIYMTRDLAMGYAKSMGEINIKIGPTHERLYDRISQGEIFYAEEWWHDPRLKPGVFGAVYMGAK